MNTIKGGIMDTKISFLKKYPVAKDVLGILIFIMSVVVGTLVLNHFVFRSYNVVGGSMENTLHGDDRVIVNRLPVTWAHFWAKEYIPKRGDVIVFMAGEPDGKLTCEPPKDTKEQYIIKRVIGLPGERVQLKDGKFSVFKRGEEEKSFDPDVKTRKNDNDGPKKHTAGEIDIIVPDGEIFVAGDNREKSESSRDSRNGLGTIPLCRVVGPVNFRIYPFNKIRKF